MLHIYCSCLFAFLVCFSDLDPHTANINKLEQGQIHAYIRSVCNDFRGQSISTEMLNKNICRQKIVYVSVMVFNAIK
jgi:predicted PilT family ATPase